MESDSRIQFLERALEIDVDGTIKGSRKDAQKSELETRIRLSIRENRAFGFG